MLTVMPTCLQHVTDATCSVDCVVQTQLSLEAAALSWLAGLTACQTCKLGPEPSQAELSPSRGLSLGLGKFGTTILKN